MATSLPDQASSPANPHVGKISSNNNNLMIDKIGTQTGPIPEESGMAGSLSTHAETLVRALRNVVIPLVHPADGENKRDAHESTLGPDGKEFVIALQKFMLSFLRSHRGLVGGIEVELKEEETEIPKTASPANNTTNLADVPPDIEATPEEDPESIVAHSAKSPNGSEVADMSSSNIEDSDAFDQDGQQFLEKAMHTLRGHVFNTMPIRLLCFKPHASKLQVTLVERGAIFTHIASTLRATIYGSNSLPLRIITGWGINETDEEAIERLIKSSSRYAILSHTWLRGASGEVTYSDWNGEESDAQQPGYLKLLNFCKTAWEDHGVAFGWMDTICINKESSTELDESIRSMYKWYRHAHVCITYLADTVTLSDMPNDSWFTRGWTLQELIAPSHMKFYNTHWDKLSDSLKTDKEDSIILKQIEKATTITVTELSGLKEPSALWSIIHIPISRRMQMAATRQVTREEDSAYSLMGIFDVSIATAYGEGAERAFSRLLQEILNSSKDGVVDMFNWAGSGGTRISTLLPSTLQDYLHRGSNIITGGPIEPLLLTHIGLRIVIMLMPALLIQSSTSQMQYDSIGNYHGIAVISILNTHTFTGMPAGSYSVLDARLGSSESANAQRERHIERLPALGILNITVGSNNRIAVPKSCLAVGLWGLFHETKLPTDMPIVFTLHRRHDPDESAAAEYNASNMDSFHFIERSELESHGMKLSTMYL